MPDATNATDATYATHGAAVLGGWSASSKVLSDCCKRKFEPRAGRSTQSQATEPQNPLEVRKQHLNLLAISSGLIVGRRLGDRGRSACPVRRAGCGNGVMATPLRHRQTKEAATDMCSLKPPRHISTPPFADIPGAKRNVCFTPKSRHRLVVGYSLCGLVAAGEEA